MTTAQEDLKTCIAKLAPYAPVDKDQSAEQTALIDNINQVCRRGHTTKLENLIILCYFDERIAKKKVF